MVGVTALSFEAVDGKRSVRATDVLIGCLALLCACAGPVCAQEKATVEDRAALNRCLSKAKKDMAAAESCVGVVQKPCLDAPDSQTTLGMKLCSGRETAVWDERLNKVYKAMLKNLGETDADQNGRKVTGAVLIRDAQRAWITFRARKCEAAGLPMEGGTGAGVLSVDCFMRETARQAIWLEYLMPD